MPQNQQQVVKVYGDLSVSKVTYFSNVFLMLKNKL